MHNGETNYEELLAMRTLALVRSLEHIRREGILKLCRDRNIKGIREHAHECPLSRLVKDEMGRREWPVDRVATSPMRITCRGNNGIALCTIPTPTFAENFMRAFDRGSYNELVADWEG